MPLSPPAIAATATGFRWIAPDEARAGGKVRSWERLTLAAGAAVTSA